MVLKVISSGSSGNGYALIGDDEILLIESGCTITEMKRAIDYRISNVKGCIISHEHGDHAKYVSQFIKSGIKIYGGYGTQKALEQMGHELIAPLLPRKTVSIGNFLVTPFEVPHGEVECYGYLIEHSDMGKLLFLTDLEYCKYNFKAHSLNHILVEANYSDDLLEIDAVNRAHVLSGHMSLQTAHKLINTNDNPMLENVVLIHLSDRNADAEKFLHLTRGVTDKKVYIARKGLEVDLSLCPF